MPKYGRRSEELESDYAYTEPTLVNQNAPYGTHYTPSYRVRIIGGKQVNVVETVRMSSKDKEPSGYKKAIQMIQPITEKPNNVDPEILSPRRLQAYHSANMDTSKSHIHGKSTTPDKRPDSKELSRFTKLPPIEVNKLRNHYLSTVFEVEPAVRIEDQARYLGTTDIKPIEIPPFIPKHKIEDDIRLKDNRYQEVKEDLNLRLKDTDTQTDEQYLSPRTMSDKGHLMSLIPQGKYLPDAPLRLSGSDQSKLFNLVQKELTKKNFDPSRLKSLYLDITAFDKNLVGYCSFQDISFTFTKHQIFISHDILRLVGAQFVSTKFKDLVNYEKLLSYLGTAAKLTEESEASDTPRSVSLAPTPEPSQYYNPPNTVPEQSPYKMEIIPIEREKNKLLRLTEVQLSDCQVQFDKLIYSFQRLDRTQRGTLSAKQIMDCCVTNSLPLTKSVVIQILSKFCEFSGDGQYRWLNFIEFLERVQPVQTGLPIPSSKQPLEYAKQLRSPRADWPMGDTAVMETKKPDSPLWKKIESPDENPVSEPVRDLDKTGLWNSYPYPTPRENYADPTNDNPPSHRRGNDLDDVDRKAKKLGEIDAIEKQLHSLEISYEKMKHQSHQSSNDIAKDPWFKRYMKLATALYVKDVDSSGFLTYKDVQNTVRMYSDAYKLDIAEEDLGMAIMDSLDGDKVAIHKLLSSLRERNSTKF